MSKHRSGFANDRRAYTYSCSQDVTTYISIINTAWIYPQSDLEKAMDTTSVSFTQHGSSIYFHTLNDLVTFYIDVFYKTAESQPDGNVGYSLGVGTVMKAYGNKTLYLKLVSGITVAVWTLMTQITNQSDLPVGGNSPDGTVGWGLIYCDWNMDGLQDDETVDIPSEYVDKLRFMVQN